MPLSLEPTYYENVRCLACGETIRRPSWKSTRSGGDGSDFVGETRRRSDFSKLAVRVRTATYGSYGNGHWHTDLQREGDSIITFVHDPPYKDDVTEVFLWDKDNKFKTGRVWRSVGIDFLSRRDALEAAMKVYREGVRLRETLSRTGLFRGGADQEDARRDSAPDEGGRLDAFRQTR